MQRPVRLRATAPTSHQMSGDVSMAGRREILVTATWALQNSGSTLIEFDARIRLNWAKAFRDDTWFEYTPDGGVRTDFIFSQTGIPVRTLFGASRTSSGGRPRANPGHGTYAFGFVLPGPAASAAAAAFWARENFFDFNFLVAPYEVKPGSLRELGEHEYKQFARMFP